MAAPFHIPTSGIWEFHLSTSLSVSTCDVASDSSLSVGVKCCHSVASVWVSLTDYTEHLFFSFTIGVSSLGKCLFRSYPFLNWFTCFFKLNFKRFLKLYPGYKSLIRNEICIIIIVVVVVFNFLDGVF